MASIYDDDWIHAPNFGVTNPMLSSPGTPGSLASIQGGDTPFPASMIKRIEEIKADGSATSTVEKKDDDGNSEVVTKKLAPQKELEEPVRGYPKPINVMTDEGPEIKNKGMQRTLAAKKAEQERMGSIFDRIALEKDDSYFYNPDDPSLDTPAKHIGAKYRFGEILNPFEWEGLKRAENPRQYLDPTGQERLDFFNRARFLSPEEEGDLEQDLITTGEADLAANRARGIREEQSILDTWTRKEEELTPEVAEDGSIEQEKIDAMWTRKNILMDEDTIRKAGPAAVKSIETLQAELEALKRDPERRHQVYLDFLRENGILKEWRPDLFKALAGAAFRMMMGDSPDDAFSYSFGALQEKKNLEEKRAHEEKIENIKQGDKTGASIKFSKDSKWVNLGTNENPIPVKMTTTEAGVPVVNWKGNIYTFDQLRAAGYEPTEYHSEADIEKHFHETVARLQKDIASIDGIDKFRDDDQIKQYVDQLEAGNQIGLALKALEDDGVDIGPGMDPDWHIVMSIAAKNFLTHKSKMRDNKKIGDKTYLAFIDDMITKKRFDDASIPDYEFQPPEYQMEIKDDKLVPKDKKNKNKFTLKKDAYAQTRKWSESWFNKFADENPGIEGLENAQINRDYIGVAYAAYTDYKKNNHSQWLAESQAGYEMGYLPFMFWLKDRAYTK